MSVPVVMMMRIGYQMRKLLFIVPPQERNVSKKLVGIVNVSSIVVNPHLKFVFTSKVCSYFEEKLIR